MMRLLRKFSRSVPEAAVVEQPPVTEARFASVARTHNGAVRELNEDRFVDLPKAGLWAVADGMGGHQAGDVAAQMAADALVRVAAGSAALSPGDVIEAVEAV